MSILNSHDFLSRVWPSKLLTHETLEMRAIDRQNQKIRREFVSSIPQFLERASDAKYEGWEIYFGVSTRYGDAGKKMDCYRVRCVWCDLDSTDKTLTEIKALKPQPNLVVESGGGFHLYWMLQHPLLVRRDERWSIIEAVNRGLCNKFDGDKMAVDASRILRVPDFFNHKYEPARKVIAHFLRSTPYNLPDFKESGIYIEKPHAMEIGAILQGRNVRDLLPEKTRNSLDVTGGGRHDDCSREDSSVITAILSAGFTPGETYATFLSSSRGRDAARRKNDHLEDYLQRTISKAHSYLKQKSASGEGPKPYEERNVRVSVSFNRKREENTDEGVRTSWSHKVEVEKVHWLWNKYIPQGKITVLAGDPGMGKSTIALDLISRISRGTFLPLSEDRTVSGTSLIASAEDAPEDTIVPRLIAAGANLRRVGIIREVGIEGETRYLCFPRDLERLRNAIVKTGARILIIDPLNAFLEKGTDTYKDQDIRMVLAPLELIAEETSCAILIIAHLNKKEDSSTLYRVGGSIGFIGAARSVLAVSKSTKDNVRVLYSLKTNLGKLPPSLSYETREIKKQKQEEADWAGEEKVKSSMIRWLGEVSFDASKGASNDTTKSSEEAEEFLRQILTDAEMPADAIYHEAKLAGVSKGLLNSVKRSIGIKITKKRDGKWWWGWENNEA